MAQTDGSVLVLQADIADPAQMDAVLAQLQQCWGALHGVFHAAGLVTGEHHSVIGELTRPKIDAQFAAKVHGTRTLARLLENNSVDFCLLFSSIAVTLGGLTLAAYAAANAFEESSRCPGAIRRAHAGSR